MSSHANVFLYLFSCASRASIIFDGKHVTLFSTQLQSMQYLSQQGHSFVFSHVGDTVGVQLFIKMRKVNVSIRDVDFENASNKRSCCHTQQSYVRFGRSIYLDPTVCIQAKCKYNI